MILDKLNAKARQSGHKNIKFTEKEVEVAEARAAKQTEDVPNGIGSLWGRLLKWFS